MTDPEAFRLDTRDLAVESGWEHEYLSRMDEFTKDGATVLVQYASDDTITSLTRSRPGRADESFSEESPGKNDRLRVWLTGRPSAPVRPKGADLFHGLKIVFDSHGTDPWAPQDFVDAVEDPADHAFLRTILERVHATSQLPAMGHFGHLFFGQRPRGGMFVHPFMRKYPPYKFMISNSGQLMVAGCWKGNFGATGHPGFAELASMLGLDHTGPASWSLVSGLDPGKLWEVGERVSRAINT